MSTPGQLGRIAELEVQVDWLRQLVDHLYQQLAVTPPVYRPPVPRPPAAAVDGLADVRALVAAGQVIQAIKLYREHTGAGLADAKAAVDAMRT
jgi:large subunit ribosomal protein L7/L12